MFKVFLHVFVARPVATVAVATLSVTTVIPRWHHFRAHYAATLVMLLSSGAFQRVPIWRTTVIRVNRCFYLKFQENNLAVSLESQKDDSGQTKQLTIITWRKFGTWFIRLTFKQSKYFKWTNFLDCSLRSYCSKSWVRILRPGSMNAGVQFFIVVLLDSFSTVVSHHCHHWRVTSTASSYSHHCFRWCDREWLEWIFPNCFPLQTHTCKGRSQRKRPVSRKLVYLFFCLRFLFICLPVYLPENK